MLAFASQTLIRSWVNSLIRMETWARASSSHIGKALPKKSSRMLTTILSRTVSAKIFRSTLKLMPHLHTILQKCHDNLSLRMRTNSSFSLTCWETRLTMKQPRVCGTWSRCWQPTRKSMVNFSLSKMLKITVASAGIRSSMTKTNFTRSTSKRLSASWPSLRSFQIRDQCSLKLLSALDFSIKAQLSFHSQQQAKCGASKSQRMLTRRTLGLKDSCRRAASLTYWKVCLTLTRTNSAPKMLTWAKLRSRCSFSRAILRVTMQPIIFLMSKSHNCILALWKQSR